MEAFFRISCSAALSLLLSSLVHNNNVDRDTGDHVIMADSKLR